MNNNCKCLRPQAGLQHKRPLSNIALFPLMMPNSCDLSGQEASGGVP